MKGFEIFAQKCSNDDLWLTLTFLLEGQFAFQAFIWEEFRKFVEDLRAKVIKIVKYIHAHFFVCNLGQGHCFTSWRTNFVRHLYGKLDNTHKSMLLLMAAVITRKKNFKFALIMSKMQKIEPKISDCLLRRSYSKLNRL